MKSILITGILGNLGSALTDYLIQNTDNLIYGITRRKTQMNYGGVKKHLNNGRLNISYGDITDDGNVNDIIRTIKPDYIFNFAGFTYVRPSWECPNAVYNINVLGLMRILEAVRKYKASCRVFQAGSSEAIAISNDIPRTEKSQGVPRNIYGGSKAASGDLIKIYRQKYNLYAVNGILFNNESPFKPEEHLTKKCTKGISRIKKAMEAKVSFEPILIGNLEAKRQWGAASDFCDAIWRMLNQEEYDKEFVNPLDFLIASNEPHSVREFINYAAFFAGLPLEWRELGLREYAVSPPDFNNKIIKVVPEFYQEEKDGILVGDSSEIRRKLGWVPQKSFQDIIREMVDFDLSNS